MQNRAWLRVSPQRTHRTFGLPEELPTGTSWPARGQDVREMDFLTYSRAATSAVDSDWALDERHWSYMDHFADSMIARGPTLRA